MLIEDVCAPSQTQYLHGQMVEKRCSSTRKSTHNKHFIDCLQPLPRQKVLPTGKNKFMLVLGRIGELTKSTGTAATVAGASRSIVNGTLIN